MTLKQLDEFLKKHQLEMKVRRGYLRGGSRWYCELHASDDLRYVGMGSSMLVAVKKAIEDFKR